MESFGCQAPPGKRKEGERERKNPNKEKKNLDSLVGVEQQIRAAQESEVGKGRIWGTPTNADIRTILCGRVKKTKTTRLRRKKKP